MPEKERVREREREGRAQGWEGQGEGGVHSREETGAALLGREEWGEETRTYILYLNAPIGPHLGLLGLGLFSEAGYLGGPPPKMEAFFTSVNRFLGTASVNQFFETVNCDRLG